MPLAPRHQHNIQAKAERGLNAITHLIEHRLIGDNEIPEVTDLETGYRFIRMITSVNDHEAAAWWVTIGITHDMLAGTTNYHTARQVTMFRSSRPAIRALLDAAIHHLASGAVEPTPEQDMVDAIRLLDAF